jgi:predicted acetyltransferase
MWVRIVDVPAALAGRRYSSPVDLVIEVRDDIFSSNSGRWRLTTEAGDGSGLAADGSSLAAQARDEAGLAASCVPAGSASPDVALDVTQLGAAYLGGTRVGALAEAGLVTELRPGALRQLSAAMAWDPAPWCPLVF